MACSLAPTVIGVFTTISRKRFPKGWHIGWLNTLIWGGAVGLAVEHIAHQEIVPWFPFLSAMSNPVDMVIMLKEIATVGIPMAAALIFAWIAMVAVYEHLPTVSATRAATKR
jgi:hypothetical protein